MMDEMQRKAKGKGLQDLMGAMDDDQMQPVLTIKISNGSNGGPPEIHDDGMEPDGSDETPEADITSRNISDELPDEEASDGGEGSGDPFQDFMKRKLKEKNGGM